MKTGRLLALNLLAAIATLAIAPQVHAQSAGTANLLSSPGSWPSTGTVSATTALGSDASAIYLNPAGLAAQDERSVLLHHGLLQFDTAWDMAAVCYPVPGLGAIGLGIARIGTSGIDAYDAGNRPLGTIGYAETSIAASVARRFYRSISAGATFKVLSQSLGDVSAAAPSLDLGIVYRPSVLRGGQVGLTVENLFAGSLSLGGPTASVDRSFRFGVASPGWRMAHLTAARAVIDLERQGSEGMKSRIGVEISRDGYGSVRAGLNANHPVVGVGINWRRYGLDIALAQGETEMTQQIALHLAWGEPVSQYEERRRAEYSKAAEDSVRARGAGQLARDRVMAEESEGRGDWEKALILWEVLRHERPEEKMYAERSRRARLEIAVLARREVEAESEQRLATTLVSLARSALLRGDLEEAAGLWRGVASPGHAPAGIAPESVVVIEAEFRIARDRMASRAAAHADSLRLVGRVLGAADEAALALRLNPDDVHAREVWAALERLVGKSAVEAASLGRKLDALTAVHQASQAFNEGRYVDAQVAVKRALALDPTNPEARAWRDRIERRMSTPKAEIGVQIKNLYIKGMEAFSNGNYREALRNWEQILVLDPLNESARRNVLEARERMKSEASR